MNLAAALAEWGPDRTAPATPAEAQAHVLGLAARHYENFPVLSVFVPRRLRPHFAAVYAYCRWADDLADEAGADGPRLLRWWRGELDACFAGTVRHPVFVALAPTLAEFALPREPFVRLLDAFERDQRQNRYADHAEIRDYCRGSADPVGELVLRLYRQAEPTRVALSDRICTGLQLANFCQDIARDAAKGRIYLPLAELARHGVTEDALRSGQVTPATQALVAAETARAEDELAAAAELAPRLAGRARWVVALFAAGGLAICRAIRAEGFRTTAVRPKLGKRDLPWMLWAAANLVRGRVPGRPRGGAAALSRAP